MFNFYSSHVLPPLLSNHFFMVPRVLVFSRFDCTELTILKQLLNAKYSEKQNLCGTIHVTYQSKNT